METLFLIPARGGSKGVPTKNIKLLAGRPLIYYTIDNARALSSDDNICVSTDDDKIIQIVENYGLSIPFKRPAELATDSSGTYEVIMHALDYYEKKGKLFDVVILLQPTSPFRKSIQITEAIELFKISLDMVVSVKETHANPYFVLFEENTEGYLEKSKKAAFTRRQDCPKVWELNGAIYVFNVKSLKQKHISEFSRIVKYNMDDASSMDIDNQMDWMFSEFLIEKGLVNKRTK
jgi:CMP-N,N'-diacetyllegionaminic acid synthase